MTATQRDKPEPGTADAATGKALWIEVIRRMDETLRAGRGIRPVPAVYSVARMPFRHRPPPVYTVAMSTLVTPADTARHLRRRREAAQSDGARRAAQLRARLPDAATEAAVRELGVRVVALPWSPGKEEHHACQYLLS